MSLDVPGVEKKTCLEAFKKLRGEGIETFSHARIFYTELAWTKPQEEGEF
jgi:hypothetical protein